MSAAFQQTGTPYYARRNDIGEYTIAGEPYPSVTTVLGMAKSEHLLAWAAKMASMKAASHLVQAGVLKLDDGDVNHRKLIEFCQGITDRTITPQQAIAEIADWPVVMREYERYRDFKAKIGSVAHHAAYEFALRGRRPCDDGHVDEYIAGIVHDLRLAHFIDGDRLVAPTEDMLHAIADPARSYCESVWEWIERANPEFEAIGLEAVVYRSRFTMDFSYGGDIETIEFPGYAGTMDWIARFDKNTYKDDWLWEGETSVRVTGDFKTSNALPDSVRMQTEAYSEADAIILIESGEHLPFDRSDCVACAHVGPHPKFSDTVTEFGQLESKTKQLGTTLHSWRKNPVVYAGFLGMCAAYHAGKADKRACKKVKEPAAPKAPTRTTVRPSPLQIAS